MYKSIAYGGVVVAAVALSGLGAGGAGASATASRAGQPAGHATVTAGQAAAAPGAQLWVKRYTGPGRGDDRASSMTVSPAGGTVFVTGASTGSASGDDYATVAYNAATGAQRWLQRYNGPANRNDRASSVAVSPDGAKVFVTGSREAPNGFPNYATVAYNAATGAQLWVNSYNGPANLSDSARSVAVSPGGGTVFVTGSSYGTARGNDYATVAYNAATGAQRWAKRYNGPGDDEASSVAVSRDGGRVFVTGSSSDATGYHDYATVGYNAATGAQLWVKRYNGPGGDEDNARSLAVSPGGGTVFVTGASTGSASGDDYATVAYNAATGAQRWLQRYNGPANSGDYAFSVAVSPGGGTVFVTGSSSSDYATVAYNAATGAQLWVKRYNGPGTGIDNARSVAVSPTGGTVYVTGESAGRTSRADYATVAYNAASGAQLWVTRYNGPANLSDMYASVAVSPDGAKVFVTGSSEDTAGWAYATIAYSG